MAMVFDGKNWIGKGVVTFTPGYTTRDAIRDLAEWQIEAPAPKSAPANCVIYCSATGGAGHFYACPFDGFSFRPSRPGDSFWIVPGTVDPMED